MSGWTPDREALLKILWTQGLSANQIAKRLGGVSRNAVIGKRIRMGLPERDSKSPRLTKAQAAKSLGKFSPQGLVIDRSRERGAPRGDWNVRFVDRTDSHCVMFVGGESHETGLICGRAVFGDKPYCKACCKLAYLPPETKRRAA
jgi:GcrA cell cycle regulator